MSALGWDVGARGSAVRVRLLGRPGCHLCEQAAAVVASVCPQGTWDEVDITSDPALLDRYLEEIPVVLVDGAVVAYWRVDADRLRAALA
jgi:hypothetical protein